MIVASIIGGLGNQMFQYAAARALSLQHGQPLCIDVSAFEGYRLHQGFELERVFRCPVERATLAEIQRILGWKSPRALRRVLARPGFRGLRGSHYVVEPHLGYWPGLRDLSPPLYLQGYWQSEKYFSEAAGILRAEFSFRQPLSPASGEVAAAIGRAHAVSLHVRRGDYVSDRKTSAILGACPLAYYRSAVRHVAERVEAPGFFVFSDDIPWAREHLDIPHPCTYVDHNRGTDSHQDMHLMSLCRHHIIANSSFSWWGAWLNPRPDKIVVAPRQWFADGRNGADICPDDWIRL